VAVAQLRQLAQVAVERVRGGEVRLLRRRRGADEVVVVVDLDLRREHVLPRELVVAVTDEALLVAVVDDRLPAGEVHQRVARAGRGRTARQR
jgi:hypothetical protein